MSKIFCLLGSFLIGVVIAGIPSYSAFIFQNLREWGFWLNIVVAIAFLIGAIADDFVAEFLGLSYRAYLSLLFGLAATILVGGLIQWR